MTLRSTIIVSSNLTRLLLLWAGSGFAQERPGQVATVSLAKAIKDRTALNGRRVQLTGEVSRSKEAIFLRISRDCINREGVIEGLSSCMADIALSDEAREPDKEEWARLKRELAATMRKGADDYYVHITVVAILDAAPIVAMPGGSKGGGATSREVGFGHLATFPIRLTIERIVRAGELVVTPHR